MSRRRPAPFATRSAQRPGHQLTLLEGGDALFPALVTAIDAARPVQQALVASGIDIREYAPSALHAKVAVVDRRWATVGSTNLDPLSLLLAREANITTTDGHFAAQLHDRLDELVTHSGEAINAVAIAQRPRRQRVLDWFAFVVMRALLFVTGHRY